MRKIRRLIFSILIIALFACSAVSYAATGGEIDTAGNYYVGGEEENVSEGTFFSIFGAGKNVTVSNTKSDDVMALAGMNILVNDSEIGSSVFAAGQNISVQESKVNGNIVAAGADINVGANSTSNAVIATGGTLHFSGTTKALHVSAGTVVIDGVINGDADITAEKVTIGDSAVVTGTLTVSAENSPSVAPGAKVGTLNFDKQKVETPKEEPVGDRILESVKSAIYWIVAMGLIGLVLCWLFSNQLTEAGMMFHMSKGAMIGSGVITLLVTPIIILITAITVIGLPLAGILGLIYTILLCIAVAFTGAALGRMLLPQLPGFASSLLGILVLEILRQIPYVGFLIWIISAVFILGYFIQSIWKKRHNSYKKIADNQEDYVESTELVEV